MAVAATVAPNVVDDYVPLVAAAVEVVATVPPVAVVVAAATVADAVPLEAAAVTRRPPS